MHRSIEITVAPGHADELIEQLRRLDDVLGLAVRRGASVKPPGDVLTVQALNRGADEVLRRVQDLHRRGVPVSVATSSLDALIDPAHRARIFQDVDQELWEEMETGLRHQCHVTANYLSLMAA